MERDWSRESIASRCSSEGSAGYQTADVCRNDHVARPRSCAFGGHSCGYADGVVGTPSFAVVCGPWGLVVRSLQRCETYAAY